MEILVGLFNGAVMLGAIVWLLSCILLTIGKSLTPLWQNLAHLRSRGRAGGQEPASREGT